MNLTNILSVSGLPGLYEMIANRPNGLIVRNVLGGKNQFAPARKHQFSPIETIGIYTNMDTMDIDKVFQKMLEQSSTLPVPDKKLNKVEAEEYFSQVLPDYDRDQVRISDINRLCKWYHIIVASGRHISSEEE